MRQAIEAEILWIYGHSARRGLAEPFLPDGTEQAVRGRGRTVAALGNLLLAEGGDGFSEPRTAPGNPFERRCPQVSSEWGNSYQALLALSEMPQVFALPGAASCNSSTIWPTWSAGPPAWSSPPAPRPKRRPASGPAT